MPEHGQLVVADRALVLCDPLFFVLWVQQNTVKYVESANEICSVKIRRWDDIDSLPLTEKLSHITKRSDGADRLSRDVDDILTVWSLDEHGLLNSLPRYFSDNVDSRPSLRLFDADMQFLLATMEKMDLKLSEFGSAIVATTAEMQFALSVSLCLKVSSTLILAQPDAHVNKQSSTCQSTRCTYVGKFLRRSELGVDMQDHSF
jgi:hypothetical protein